LHAHRFDPGITDNAIGGFAQRCISNLGWHVGEPMVGF
jgi:hypothetical protein